MKKYKYIFIIIAIFTFIFTSCNSNKNSNKKHIPKSEKGVIDLTEWDFENDGMVNLDGEWEFYWNEFIEPLDIEKEKNKMTAYVTVPMTWKDIAKNLKNDNIKPYGYGTYRLKVKLNKKIPIVILQLKLSIFYHHIKFGLITKSYMS